MVAWVTEFVIALSSGRDASVLHHKTAKDMRKNRTLVDQNMLLRITFKSLKYAFENHIQQCKSAAENQFRLRGGTDGGRRPAALNRLRPSRFSPNCISVSCCCSEFRLRLFISAEQGRQSAFIDVSDHQSGLCCPLGADGQSPVGVYGLSLRSWVKMLMVPHLLNHFRLVRVQLPLVRLQ